MPLGPNSQSPWALLFSCPISGNMLAVNRAPIYSNNNHDHYEALVERQQKVNRNYDMLRCYTSILVGSNVVVQQEDGVCGPWDHCKQKWPQPQNQSYRVLVTKTKWLITKTSKLVKATSITVKEYLWDQLSKDWKIDTLEDIIRHLEQWSWQDNDTYPERDNNNTVDNSHHSYAVTNQRKITYSKQIVQCTEINHITKQRNIMMSCEDLIHTKQVCT